MIVKMKVFDIFMALLIAGVWSPTISHAAWFDFDFDVIPISKEDVKISLRESCVRNNEPYADEIAEQVSEYLSNWRESVNADVMQLGTDLAVTQIFTPWRTLNGVFKKYCRQIPTIENRIRYVAESVNSCLDSQERINVVKARNAASSILRVGCENNANGLAQFADYGGVKCAMKNRNEIQSCVEDLSRTLSSRCTSYDLRIFRSCVVTAMENCTRQRPAEILDILLHRALRGIC